MHMKSNIDGVNNSEWCESVTRMDSLLQKNEILTKISLTNFKIMLHLYNYFINPKWFHLLYTTLNLMCSVLKQSYRDSTSNIQKSIGAHIVVQHRVTKENCIGQIFSIDLFIVY